MRVDESGFLQDAPAAPRTGWRGALAEVDTEERLLRVEASGQAGGRQILHVAGQVPYDGGPFTAERFLGFAVLFMPLLI